MATEAQTAANKLNGLKSKGPKTEAGKAKSRGNAITHGLTIENPALFETFHNEAAERKREFAAEFRPATPLEAELCDRMAIASVRSRACLAEETRRSRYVASRTEPELWEIDRSQAAAKLAEALPKRPNHTLHALKATLQGTEWLIDAWENILACLNANQPFDDAFRSRVLDLMGVPLDQRSIYPKLDGLRGSRTSAAERARAQAVLQLVRLKRRATDQLLDDNESLRRYAASGLPLHDMREVHRIRNYEQSANRVLFRYADYFLKRNADLRKAGVIPPQPAPQPQRQRQPQPITTAVPKPPERPVATFPPTLRNPFQPQPAPAPAFAAAPIRAQTPLVSHAGAAVPDAANPPIAAAKPVPAAAPEPQPDAVAFTVASGQGNPRVVSRSEAPGLNRVQRKALARQRRAG